MLFNSYIFILAFLPITLCGYFIFGSLPDKRPAKAWLVVASAVFYGWWSVPFLLMLYASITVNFFFGRSLLALADKNSRHATTILTIGIICNLSLLAYFKYATFIANNVFALTGIEFAVGAIALPLAISFYTFQQIAYLTDCKGGLVKSHQFVDYVLFVTFFPQLIAGPIVHHSEMMPQFQEKPFRFRHEYFSPGLAFFIIGLVKKVLIADPVSDLADPIFSSNEVHAYGFAEAWIAVLAATVGIYFDFSGYSDMAVGLARMFGIRLPYNFNSPYKAASIIDFWRRWHMTLSRFLRDYLYIPLGGNRNGEARRCTNLMLTMLLGGLWHGAGWTFVVWGGLHGFYLLVNRLWQVFQERLAARGLDFALPTSVARTLTMAAVMLAWVFFYATSFEQAAEVIRGAAGLNGIDTVVQGVVMDGLLADGGGSRAMQLNIALLCVGILIALFAPNSQEIIDGEIARKSRNPLLALFTWRPNGVWAAISVAVFMFILTQMSNVKEFVYFQF